MVTGAARGIGAGVARAAAGRGARLGLVGLEPQRLAEVADEIGGDACWAEADVTDGAALQEAIGQVVGRLGGIDVLFVNAGIANFGPLRTMDPAQFRRILEVNLVGAFLTLRAALPHVVAARGYVLLNASISAALAPPGFGAYGASKAAVEALGNVFRQELRHLGVDVGVCYFGFIDTDLVGMASEVYPAFRLMKANLPPPAGMMVPLMTAVDAAIHGMERRAARVVAPWPMHLLLWLRGLLVRIAPGRAAVFMPELERLSAETAAAHGGVSPTTERPDEARRGPT